MNFKYSSFISYRRNIGDEKFLKNFKAIIETEAFRATNIQKAFFDETSIRWGDEFDEKIYDGIAESYFFIPIYHCTYLHQDNVWCARELYHAIEVEKIIHSRLNDDYCYVLPIIHRGFSSALPSCLEKKNAKDIRQLEYAITNNKQTAALIKFRNNICETLNSYYRLFSEENIDLKELCLSIHKPTDEEIKIWIKEQKEKEKNEESSNLPILKKYAK